MSESESFEHDCVGLSNELHVSVFDPVVYHLDEMTTAGLADPFTAWLAVRLGSDTLEDVLQMRPGGWVSSGH